jgi:hypothetical protein
VNEKPARELPIPTSSAPLKSAAQSMNEVKGLASGPKNNRPPVASPQPFGVPIVFVSMLAISVGSDRNRSKRVPPVAPVLVKVNSYENPPPAGETV